MNSKGRDLYFKVNDIEKSKRKQKSWYNFKYLIHIPLTVLIVNPVVSFPWCHHSFLVLPSLNIEISGLIHGSLALQLPIMPFHLLNAEVS